MRKNKFISFEGGDGSGKTTQVEMLAEYLRKKGEKVVTTREPGGVESAEAIRDLILNHKENPFDGLTQVLLHFAARAEHVKKLILPALEDGEWVITDRFFDSTYVYQSEVDIKLINQIREVAIGGFAPDKTFILDLPVEIAKERMKARASENFYDRKGEDFFQKIRGGFLKIANEYSARCVVIDASRDAKDVHNRVLENL